MRRLATCLCIALFTLSCGTKSGPTLSITLADGASLTATANPFIDPNVVDVVFQFINEASPVDVTDASGEVVIAAGSILDENGDNVPDRIAAPSTCTTTFAAQCGFPVATAVYELEDIPLNHRYTASIGFRNAAGTFLYEGTSAAFNNIVAPAPTITIIIEVSN